MIPHKFSSQEIDFIRNNAKGLLSKELTKVFNREFNVNLNELQIVNAKKRNGIKSGPTTNSGAFKKGARVSPKTEFKKEQVPHNWVAVGKETTVEGYAMVKVAEPSVWEYKHLMVWEEHHGTVPEGKVVMFGDRDKANCSIDNLILVSRKQLISMVRLGMIKDDPVITRTGLMLADLDIKIHELSRA